MIEKVIEINELFKIVKESKKEGKQIVFTNGCFDILHVGHIRLLKKAKEVGDLLIIGLNSDSSVKSLKGAARPIIPERERAELLAAIKYIDYITIFTESTASRVLSILKPDIYVKGGNYSAANLPEWSVVKKFGGKINIIPLEGSRSTSAIINKIKDS